MKATQMDLVILNTLKLEPTGICFITIVGRIKKDKGNTYRSLTKLVRNGHVKRSEHKTPLYTLSLGGNPPIYREIMCPKCKTINNAEYKQDTKKCENMNCLTKGKKRTRFRVTNKRTIKIYSVM